MAKTAMHRTQSSAKKVQAQKEETFRCPFCNKDLPKTKFYSSSDPRVLTGITRICKDCSTAVARRKTDAGEFLGETRESVQDALEYLDKPFYEDLWETAVFSANKPPERGKKKENKTIWGVYLTSLGLNQYHGKRWRDSDIFKDMTHVSKVKTESIYTDAEALKEAYEQNRKDVIKIIGYDPFDEYPSEKDMPLLYSQLVNFLDEETKNDAMKMIAAIQIVKSQAQITNLNAAIDAYTIDVTTAVQNNAVVKNLSETVSKLVNNINSLAKENGISITNNNNKSKGAFTLSGKEKHLRDIGFREAEINTFDIGTCEGMRQVAEISEEARHKQIGYDENIASEIKDIKVELVEQYSRERDEALERARILLVENRDLKDFLIEKRLMTEDGEVIEY